MFGVEHARDRHPTESFVAAHDPPKPGLGAPAQELARLWRVQKDLVDGFRLSFDLYGRSSSPENHALTQHFAGRLADAGLIS